MESAGSGIVILVLIVVPAALAFIPAVVASGKGRNGFGYWLFGFVAFIPALIVALVIAPTSKGEERMHREAGRHRCRYCREYIQSDASICPHCRNANPQPTPVQFWTGAPTNQHEAWALGVASAILQRLRTASAAEYRALVESEESMRRSGLGKPYDAARRCIWRYVKASARSSWLSQDAYDTMRAAVTQGRTDVDSIYLSRAATIAGMTWLATAVGGRVRPDQLELVLRPWHEVFGELDPAVSAETTGVAEPSDNAARCTHCGTTLKPGARFCGSCGTRAPVRPSSISTSGPPPLSS